MFGQSVSGPGGIESLTKQGGTVSCLILMKNTQIDEHFVYIFYVKNCCTRELWKLSVCGWFQSAAVILANARRGGGWVLAFPCGGGRGGLFWSVKPVVVCSLEFPM